jgi:hypothetical protein
MARYRGSGGLLVTIVEDQRQGERRPGSTRLWLRSLRPL